MIFILNYWLVGCYLKKKKKLIELNITLGLQLFHNGRDISCVIVVYDISKKLIFIGFYDWVNQRINPSKKWVIRMKTFDWIQILNSTTLFCMSAL